MENYIRRGLLEANEAQSNRLSMPNSRIEWTLLEYLTPTLLALQIAKPVNRLTPLTLLGPLLLTQLLKATSCILLIGILMAVLSPRERTSTKLLVGEKATP